VQLVTVTPKQGVAFRFLLPAEVVPAKLGLGDGADRIQERQSAMRQEQPQPDPAQKQVIEVDDAFRAGCPAQLGPQAGGGLDRRQLARRGRGEQLWSVGAVAAQQPQALDGGERLRR
jgi:hypothetical protein